MKEIPFLLCFFLLEFFNFLFLSIYFSSLSVSLLHLILYLLYWYIFPWFLILKLMYSLEIGNPAKVCVPFNPNRNYNFLILHQGNHFQGNCTLLTKPQEAIMTIHVSIILLKKFQFFLDSIQCLSISTKFIFVSKT